MSHDCEYYNGNNDCYFGRKIHIGTVNKLDTMEKYIEAWPLKVVQFQEKYNGVIFVDAMCGPGEYVYTDKKTQKEKTIQGTSLRVYNILSKYRKNPKMQKAYLMINDHNEQAIKCQKCRIERESKKYYPQKVVVHYSQRDVSEYIEQIIQALSAKSDCHILFFYDPFKVDIRWAALEKLFRRNIDVRNRIDLIITHFHQNDPSRAIPRGIKDPQKRARYEQTYEMQLEAIENNLKNLTGYERSKWFRDRMVEIMCRRLSIKPDQVAYAPIFNSRDSSVYDIVFFSNSKRAKDLFKSTIYKTINEHYKSVAKSKPESENHQQLSLDLGDIEELTPKEEFNKDIDRYYSVSYFARYIAERFSGKKGISKDTLESFLFNHPFIPSQGIKVELDNTLKNDYQVKITQKRGEGKRYHFPEA